MKILYVAHEGKMGGASKSLAVLAGHMAEKGHDVTVLMPFEKCELKEQLARTPQIHIISLFYSWWQYPARAGKVTSLAFIAGYALNWIAKLRLLWKFRGTRFDIVHSNSSVINIGAFISRITDAKHVWHFREFGEPDLGTRYIMGRKHSMNYVAKRTDRVIYISRAIQKYYGSWLDEKLGVVIYNGIGVDYLQTKEPEDSCRDGKVHFLISGALQKGKGQECAIEAARILRERGITGYEVVIAGRNINQYQTVLEDMVHRAHLEDQVSFAGFVTDMAALRRKSDVELVCSDREAFGRVTIEYMCNFMPVIGSANGGTTELIQNGYNGYLYEPENYDELAEYMGRLINNTGLLENLGKNARKFSEQFSIKRNAEKIYEVYKEVENEKV